VLAFPVGLPAEAAPRTLTSLDVKGESKSMQRYIEMCSERLGAERLVPLLSEIIAQPAVHARFVNTLSRLEYVGVRKMLKSRRAESLNVDGLQHVLDETVHSLRLKKAALALAVTAGSGARVTTFSDDDTLAGHAGEDYLQAIDGEAEALLADPTNATIQSGASRVDANYLLTSAAIEVRAQVFYPIYDRLLTERGIGFSVASIAKDEDRHLAEMARGLARVLPEWRQKLELLLVAEERYFCGFLDATRSALELADAA
jgi:hypothetical protein